MRRTCVVLASRQSYADDTSTDSIVVSVRLTCTSATLFLTSQFCVASVATALSTFCEIPATCKHSQGQQGTAFKQGSAAGTSVKTVLLGLQHEISAVAAWCTSYIAIYITTNTQTPLLTSSDSRCVFVLMRLARSVTGTLVSFWMAAMISAVRWSMRASTASLSFSILFHSRCTVGARCRMLVGRCGTGDGALVHWA